MSGNHLDTPEMAQYCLHCRWNECWDCLHKSNLYSFGLRLELDDRVAERLARKILREIRNGL